MWRVVLAAALLLAAWGKWHTGVNTSPFPETIYDRIVRAHIWMHYTLIAYEVLLGAWLLSGIRPRWAAGAVLVTLLAFCVLIARELISPDPLGCGCGLQPLLPGRGPEVVRWELLMSLGRNLTLMLGAVYVMVMAQENAECRRRNDETNANSEARNQKSE